MVWLTPPTQGSIDHVSHEWKKKRAWFVCPQWRTLVADHYSSDIEAARALRTDPRVLAKLRTGTPVAKSTVLKMLRQAAHRHPLGVALKDLVIDTRLL
jgi:hypothetical protein